MNTVSALAIAAVGGVGAYLITQRIAGQQQGTQLPPVMAAPVPGTQSNYMQSDMETGRMLGGAIIGGISALFNKGGSIFNPNGGGADVVNYEGTNGGYAGPLGNLADGNPYSIGL